MFSKTEAAQFCAAAAANKPYAKTGSSVKTAATGNFGFVSVCSVSAVLAAWELLCRMRCIPEYMLPSPAGVVRALVHDAPLLLQHSKTTLFEAAAGISISIIAAFAAAFLMDRWNLFKKALYPFLVFTQTVPSIAVAPLLILWLGYGVLAKIVLIVLTCSFPLAINLASGFASADGDSIRLLKTMGATERAVFIHIKVPSSLPFFFSGLKLAVSYAVVGAVISEWLGGTQGLGVYMIRVKKSYAFDKMFAVIFLISALSLFAVAGISLLEKRIIKK